MFAVGNSATSTLLCVGSLRGDSQQLSFGETPEVERERERERAGSKGCHT